MLLYFLLYKKTFMNHWECEAANHEDQNSSAMCVGLTQERLAEKVVERAKKPERQHTRINKNPEPENGTRVLV